MLLRAAMYYHLMKFTNRDRSLQCSVSILMNDRTGNCTAGRVEGMGVYYPSLYGGLFPPCLFPPQGERWPSNKGPFEGLLPALTLNQGPANPSVLPTGRDRSSYQVGPSPCGAHFNPLWQQKVFGVLWQYLRQAV